MKRFILLVLGMISGLTLTFAQVGINTDGTAPDGTAMLDVKSTNMGFLAPRVADTNAIGTPVEGLQVYDLSSHCMRYYNGTRWSDCLGSYSWLCGISITINHVAGAVAPVTKTVTYGTVRNIPGEPSKCWITRNLGASQQATAVNDATEASAGWYWQFNRKQGYKHDGATLTPSWTITSITENMNWQTANDPCTLELGTGWHIPTYTEWYNVDNTGGWTNWTGPWNSALKMHAAGDLSSSNGSLSYRGLAGYYWSSMQSSSIYGSYLYFQSSSCYMSTTSKAFGFSLRCIRE